MVPEKENPHFDDSSLAAESKVGADDASGLPLRLDRYSKAHHRALHMADYALERGEVKLSANLRSCGNYLLFRDYYTVGKVRLHAAKFCNKHLLCPLCAIRRGARQVRSYLDRLQVILASQPDLKLSMLTLTVKDGDDLGERFRHLTNSFRKMQQARRSYLRGKGSHVELAKVEGAVGSYEFKRGKNSGQWHPHVHMVVLHRSDIDPRKLSDEWHKFTGDSFIVDVTPFRDGQPPVEGFLEVFKYALKFSDLPFEDNWEGFKTLSGRRLVFSFGDFYGVDVPEELADEQLEDLPFVELLYKFVYGVGYSLSKVSSPQLPRKTEKSKIRPKQGKTISKANSVKGQPGSRSGAQPKASTERVRTEAKRSLDRLAKTSSGRAGGLLKTAPRTANPARDAFNAFEVPITTYIIHSSEKNLERIKDERPNRTANLSGVALQIEYI